MNQLSPTNTDMTNAKRPGRFLAFFLFAIVFCRPSNGCEVPVFRYALERWKADKYRVVVMHQGSLNSAETAAINSLKKKSQFGDTSSNLIDLRVIQVNENKTPRNLLKIWSTRAIDANATMFVFYPKENSVEGAEEPFFQAPLTKDNVSSLFDSPLRRRIVKQFEKGDSAVWVFVQCGRRKDDSAALERLQQQVSADMKWMELPSAKELEIEPETLKQVKIPLKISFSVLELDRKNQVEQFLLKSLMHSEIDLKEFDQPLAFPVFGRGRVLYGLVGKGIASETIREASSFVAGPCSCQVKNQNPGFDLLITNNWEKAIGDKLISKPVESVDTENLKPKLLTIPPGRKSR